MSLSIGRLRILAFAVCLVAIILGCCSACDGTTNDCNSSNHSHSQCYINGGTPSSGAISPSGVQSAASPSNTSMASSPATPGSPPGTNTSTASSSPKVYYDVPVQPLCDDGQCGGTLQVGNTTFSYTDSALANDFPEYDENQAFTIAATSCSELTVQFSCLIWGVGRAA
jgi:hypothetical protein